LSRHRHRTPLPLPSFPTRRSSDLPAAATHSFTVVRSVDSYSANETSGSVARYLDASPPPMLSSSTRAPVDSSIAAQSSTTIATRSEEHTSELQSPYDLVCRLLLEK